MFIRVQTCLLRSNFQQNSCSAKPSQHSRLQRSCCAGFALQLLCTCTLYVCVHIKSSANPRCNYIACYNSLHRLGYSLVSCLVLHVVWSVHVRVRTCYSLIHACAYVDRYCTSCMDVKQRIYEALQHEKNGGLKLAWSRVSLYRF